jgi:hypothetical protein
MSENPKLNVYQKIHAVMKDVEYLQKDDKISFGQTNYKAISEEKVTSTIRKSLIEHGLVIIPIDQEHSKDGNLTTVNVKYQITDIETGENIIAVSSGTGADTQDKGVGKAMTYSYKYLLLRTFAIPTGEDPDKIISAELDSKQKEEPQSGSKMATLKEKWQTLAGSLEGFDDFYKKQQDAGYNDTQIDKFLTTKLKNQEKKGA